MYTGCAGKSLLINHSSLTPFLASLTELFLDVSVFTSSVDLVECSVYCFLEPIKQKCLTAVIIYKTEGKAGNGDKTFSASAILKQAKVSPRRKKKKYHSSKSVQTCVSFQVIYLFIFIFRRIICSI